MLFQLARPAIPSRGTIAGCPYSGVDRSYARSPFFQAALEGFDRESTFEPFLRITTRSPMSIPPDCASLPVFFAFYYKIIIFLFFLPSFIMFSLLRNSTFDRAFLF
jgi:hypothetical protein